MKLKPLSTLLLLLCAPVVRGESLPGVREAMAPFLEKNEIAGAVTLVVTPDKVVHLRR
jgi:hypothetical protein